MPVSYEIETLTSGMIANQRRHEVISNNLANVDAIGFKKDVPVNKAFSSVLSKAQGSHGVYKSLPEKIYRTRFDVDTDVSVNNIYTAYQQGGSRETNNKFDLSIMGEGFFAVQAEQGVVYTRKGNFMLNHNNELVTSQGDIVLGAEGAEEIGGVPIRIDGKNIVVANNGAVQIDGISNGQLKIVDFDDYQKLKKIGHSLFAYEGDEKEIHSATNFFVEQGYLESSNVNALSEMTAMLSNTRNYELAGKSMKAVEGTLNRTISELGKFK
ncbi:MAG: flagellar hook-basal body protein [Candidatus Omnitrophica bacterium]|nr:flagellar hook-basal body protein [Candidatus Omnitrophota bacterium]